MTYEEQNRFFAQAYRTGTDSWTNIPFARRAAELAERLPKGALVLDLGSGRGALLFEYAHIGLRAIGLENNPDLVKRGNNEVLAKGLEKNIRFMDGSALDIPLADTSFDAVSDIGLMQHIRPEDYAQYVSEIARVLKPGGLAFLAVLSKDTPKYFAWHPRKDELSDYIKEGVHYHFFSDEEIKSLFGTAFDIQEIDHDKPHGPKGTVYAIALLKKK